LISVEGAVDMLGMKEFAEAVVEVPESGLNVKQRKLLTIGVELAAKPSLLLFLDERTSRLDSQSSWAIIKFPPQAGGQWLSCSVNDSSAELFQSFDQLLFLA
jgi:ATP-binding cassette, subfamily G (WHITE), member 2, PDR